MDSQDSPQQPYTPPQSEPPLKTGVINQDAKTMAMLAHLLGTLFGFIGPLVIYLAKKDENPFIEDQAKEALNFHIMLVIAYVVSGVITIISCGVLFFVMFVPWVLQIVLGILGTVQANNGQYYRYPLTYRFIP